MFALKMSKGLDNIAWIFQLCTQAIKSSSPYPVVREVKLKIRGYVIKTAKKKNKKRGRAYLLPKVFSILFFLGVYPIKWLFANPAFCGII